MKYITEAIKRKNEITWEDMGYIEKPFFAMSDIEDAVYEESFFFGIDSFIREWLEDYRGWSFYEAKDMIVESLQKDAEIGKIFVIKNNLLSPQFRWKRGKVYDRWDWSDFDEWKKDDEFNSEWDNDHPFPGTDKSFRAFMDESAFDSDNFMGDNIDGEWIVTDRYQDFRLIQSLLYLKKNVKKIRPGVYCAPQKQETDTFSPVPIRSSSEPAGSSGSSADSSGSTGDAYGIPGSSSGGAAAAQSAASQTAEEALKPKEEERHTITFIVVDQETKGPIRDICLGVLLTGGDETTAREYYTDANGEIKLVDLEPGQCELRCDTTKQTLKNTLNFVEITEDTTPSVSENPKLKNPQWTGILEIEPYKVKTDDTLAGIAEAHDLTPKQLMEFNWETTDPDEINEKLYETVGCRQTTADGKNLMFSDDDKPGIIYIPKSKIIEGLDTDKTHVIGVKVLGYEPVKTINKKASV